MNLTAETYISNSLEETSKISKKFVMDYVHCLNTAIILLEGDLGAGKTTFARGLITEILKQDVEVTSPTFNIVSYYDNGINKIHHFDLYRIKSADELEEIGFYEAIDSSISIIEWHEIASDIIFNTKDTTIFKITLEHMQNIEQDSARKIHIQRLDKLS